MRVQGVKSNNRSIRPVILAGNRQRRLWPLSTPETPFCLRSINSRPALLMRILQALEANPAFGPPIIILADTAARLGIAEITRIRPDATIILVPCAVGSGISSLLAAIKVANTCVSAQIALIPASFFATDPVDAFRSLANVAIQSSIVDKVVLMTSRSNASHAGLSIELGARIENTSLFSLKQFHQNVSLIMTNMLQETNSLVSTSGPALVSTQALLKHIQSDFPTTYVACHNALKLAEKYGNTYRPQQDFLSFAGKPNIRDFFQSVLPSLRAFIGNPDWRSIETFKDPLFDEYQSQPITPVGIAGPQNQKIIASNDGILVLSAGYEDAVKNHYPDGLLNHVGGTNPHQKGPSLRFTA